MSKIIIIFIMVDIGWSTETFHNNQGTSLYEPSYIIIKNKCIAILDECNLKKLLPFRQWTLHPSFSNRLANTIIVSDTGEVVLWSSKRSSPYSTNTLSLYALTICSLRSVHLTVEAKSILPAANRLSMIVGMLKLTASRMWHSEKSIELRQSSMSNWHLLLDDSSVASHSQPTQMLDNTDESSSAGISEAAGWPMQNIKLVDAHWCTGHKTHAANPRTFYLLIFLNNMTLYRVL